MSEEQRITKVEKEKDPRRVEAGKRLASISKASKEKKKAEAQRMERIDEEPAEDIHDGGYSMITVITGVGVLTGLVCLYFTYRQDKRAQADTESHDEVHPQPQKQSADQRPSHNMLRNKLRSLDD